MGSLDCLDVEVNRLLLGMLSNCGISRVGQWAGLPVAKTGDVVLVAAKGLLLVRSCLGLASAMPTNTEELSILTLI